MFSSGPSVEGAARLARHGRRAGREAEENESEKQDDNGRTAESNAGQEEEKMPPAPKKTGGWSMDGPTEAPPSEPVKFGRRAGQEGGDEQVVGEPASHPAKSKFDDKERDFVIETIPDLEDAFDDEEDIANQVSAPPKMQTGIQSIEELDSDIHHTLPSSAGEIDISILTSQLLPREQCLEDDVPWEFETLLAQVKSEMEKYQEKEEDGEEENPAAAEGMLSVS